MKATSTPEATPRGGDSTLGALRILHLDALNAAIRRLTWVAAVAVSIASVIALVTVFLDSAQINTSYGLFLSLRVPYEYALAIGVFLVRVSVAVVIAIAASALLSGRRRDAAFLRQEWDILLTEFPSNASQESVIERIPRWQLGLDRPRATGLWIGAVSSVLLVAFWFLLPAGFIATRAFSASEWLSVLLLSLVPLVFGAVLASLPTRAERRFRSVLLEPSTTDGGPVLLEGVSSRPPPPDTSRSSLVSSLRSSVIEVRSERAWWRRSAQYLVIGSLTSLIAAVGTMAFASDVAAAVSPAFQPFTDPFWGSVDVAVLVAGDLLILGIALVVGWARPTPVTRAILATAVDTGTLTDSMDAMRALPLDIRAARRQRLSAIGLSLVWMLLVVGWTWLVLGSALSAMALPNPGEASTPTTLFHLLLTAYAVELTGPVAFVGWLVTRSIRGGERLSAAESLLRSLSERFARLTRDFWGRY